MFSLRYVDTPIERPRWRFNVAWRATPRLSIGLEYNPVVAEVLPTANWIAHVETEQIPLISLGTSSDRIGTAEGKHAYYITFAKSMGKVAPYVAINYSESDRRLTFPCGINLSLAPQWDLLGMFDGKRTHLLLTYKVGSFNVTGMLIWMKTPGISIGWGL